MILHAQATRVLSLPAHQPTEYEKTLERMDWMQFCAELDEVFASQDCEMLRLYRRELARRLYRVPGAA